MVVLKEVTEEGISNFERLVHLQNALGSIDTKPSGKLTDDKLGQFMNAVSGIFLTVEGTVIVCKYAFPLSMLLGSSETWEGIV